MTATIELDHLLMSHQHLSTPLSLGRPAKRRRCPDHHPHSDRADPNRAQEFAQNFWKKLSPSAGPSRQSIQLGSIQSATSRLLLLIRGCRAAVVRQHAIVSRIGPVLRPHPIPYHPIPKTHSRPCCRQLWCVILCRYGETKWLFVAANTSAIPNRGCREVMYIHSENSLHLGKPDPGRGHRRPTTRRSQSVAGGGRSKNFGGYVRVLVSGCWKKYVGGCFEPLHLET